MSKKRDTITYELKRGRKVVYRGTTKNPDRRAEEHKAEGKKFDKLVRTSIKMTEQGAKKKEERELATYRSSHRGKNPIYNKDSDG